MDPSNRTLDSMLAVPDPSQLSAFAQAREDEERPPKRRGVDQELGEDDDEIQRLYDGEIVRATVEEVRGKEMPESLCDFTSIHDLRQAAKRKGNNGAMAADECDFH